MKREKKTIAVLLVASIGLSLFVGLAAAVPDNPVSIPNLLSSILTGISSIQTTVNDVRTELNNIQNELNSVQIEQVIQTDRLLLHGMPMLKISCNRPWNLLAIYISAEGVVTGDSLEYGGVYLGERFIGPLSLTVVDGSDVTNFPILASEMTASGQSIIPVAPGADVEITANGFSQRYAGFYVTIKVLIQRPLDHDFSYTLYFDYFHYPH